jgi:hypothetical protein
MIQERFPGVEVVGLSDKGTTGNFEIVVNGVLVWSKKTRSEGFFDKATDAQRSKVYEAIQGSQGETKRMEISEYSLPGGDGINSISQSNMQPLLASASTGEKPKATKKDILCSLCTTVASIPAIIGA